ncbi:MAG: DUF3014 domain-containing protein [Halieaceae bacterium]|nr:DUF3014 domain-containing protein [Halieaceae bacterium]
MQADPSERISEPGLAGGPPMVPILAGLVVLVVLAVWWFSSGEDEEPAPPEPAPVVEPEPAALPDPEPEPAPDIPEPTPAPEPEPAPAPAPPPEPPLTLETSDAALREQLGPALAVGPLAPVLQADNLVERGAAVLDGLSRGVLQYKLLPVIPPEGKFAVRKRGNQALMDPVGFRRYDSYARAIESLDTALLVAAFNRFRPLLEEAYAMLGYEAEDFDNALIRGLDRVIEAPVIERPIEIRKVEAVYKYEDPNLERLPEVHKQLLRMGPENTRRIQAQARALRSALLSQ